VQVGLLLQRRQVDDAERADAGDVIRVLDAGLLHGLAGALDNAAHARLADEHVVGFLGQHEAAGARERIEARLRQALELHLAVAVGEEREHEEGKPVRRGLVEGAEHARLVLVPGAALQQALRFLAAILAEIFLQQVDHGPQVPAFLDVDLEQVAHVVERRRGLAQVALLLDAGRLRVALDDDEAAQHGAIFAGNLLPGLLALVPAEIDEPVLGARRQQNAPAVLGHLHVVELGPALGVDADGGAQIHVGSLEPFRPHGHPPVDVARMPLLQRLQHTLIVLQPDVVGDLGRVIDVRGLGHERFL
jgi:hypothetical protein